MIPKFHVVPGDVVQSVLDSALPQIVGTVADAYARHEDGQTVNPNSHFLRFPNSARNRIIALPAAFTGEEDAVSGLKWIASYPENLTNGMPRASAVLILNDGETGFPFAVMESAQISAIRTAASAALGLRAIANAGGANTSGRVPSLGIVGAGLIASTIARMLLAEGHAFNHVVVHDLRETSAHRLASDLRDMGFENVSTGGLPKALDCETVVFATSAVKPYVGDGFRFRAGQTVANISLRDIAPELILDANNIFDDVDHCLQAETSPHLAEQQTGGRDFVTGTIVQLMREQVTLEPQKPTIYSPFGMGILDLALGKMIFDAALRENRTTIIPNFFVGAGL